MMFANLGKGMISLFTFVYVFLLGEWKNTCNLNDIIWLYLLIIDFRSRTILDDFREAYYWLRQNTHDKARIMSWWDYGYQIAGMGNRTTLVDNNTWNNSHIALVSAGIMSGCCASRRRALELPSMY